ncbi:MAG: LCP family protein [Clostridiales bacterium]|nr:LCP family protein [Clostridiales bacterium]MCR5273842.1 LCP family protein [Clostridiales bacterium]
MSSNTKERANAGSSKQAPKKKKSVARILIKILCFILCAILGLGGGVLFYLNKNFKYGYLKIRKVSNSEYETIDFDNLDDIDLDSGDVASSWADGGHTRVYVNKKYPIKKVAQKDSKVENILVFGVDSRGTNDVTCRADALLVVSIDKRHDCVKMISLMRDTGVKIEGRSKTDKLTHAYAYGGVGLLINTINENFGLDIQNFVMLDFGSSSALIDMIGGVEIDVTAGEVKYANQNIAEENALLGTNTPMLTHEGKQTLTGIQATSWARIRSLDSDYVRSSRQRTLAIALMHKVKDEFDFFEQAAILEDSAGMFETNLTASGIMSVALDALDALGNVKEYRAPADGMFTVQQNPWMMLVDWDKQLKELHGFIWEEE